MYYYYYEGIEYESKGFNTETEAENAYPKIAAHIASLYGFCDPDRLFIAENDPY